MKKKYFVFLFLILTISSVSSLQINDTIFFASETNFTIFVDSITLDQVTVTNQSITFINLTSVGSNFTNINARMMVLKNILSRVKKSMMMNKALLVN